MARARSDSRVAGQVDPFGKEKGGRTHLKTRSSRQAMRRAVKAHATITAAFRVGRSRSRLEMRITRASPLLLELPPPAIASPDPTLVVFPGPGSGGGRLGSSRGAVADWARLARAAGAARSASSSSCSKGAACMVRAGGTGRAGRAAEPGSRTRAEACTRGSHGPGGCAVLGRKLRRPEEPAPPPPPPPTRCTESFDGLRPHVGGAGHQAGCAHPRPQFPRGPGTP